MDLSKYLTSKDVQDKRMSICKKCDQYIEPTKMCSKCSCYMVWKVQIPHVMCPINKWSHETNRNIKLGRI